MHKRLWLPRRRLPLCLCLDRCMCMYLRLCQRGVGGSRTSSVGTGGQVSDTRGALTGERAKEQRRAVLRHILLPVVHHGHRTACACAGSAVAARSGSRKAGAASSRVPGQSAQSQSASVKQQRPQGECFFARVGGDKDDLVAVGTVMDLKSMPDGSGGACTWPSPVLASEHVAKQISTRHARTRQTIATRRSEPPAERRADNRQQTTTIRSNSIPSRTEPEMIRRTRVIVDTMTRAQGRFDWPKAASAERRE